MKNLGEVKTFYKSLSSEEESGKDIASIGQMGEVDRFSADDLSRLKIINASMQNTKIINIFRELRTQLVRKNKKKNFVCMVSSICHGGGASYIAANLAAVFALDKAKTSMLIDANLYSPSVERLIFGEASSGITDFLSDQNLSIKDVVYATGIPRLRAIPLGENSEGAAEYFSSGKMLEFVNEVKSRYSDRYIFIDAPPILAASEARILAEIVDMVVLVVSHGRATLGEVESAVKIIEKEKLAGLVYNN